MKTIKLTDKSTNEQCSPIVSDTTIQCQKKSTTLDKIINTSDYFIDRLTFDDENSSKQKQINEIKEQLQYCLYNTRTDDTIKNANGSFLIASGSFYFTKKKMETLLNLQLSYANYMTTYITHQQTKMKKALISIFRYKCFFHFKAIFHHKHINSYKIYKMLLNSIKLH